MYYIYSRKSKYTGKGESIENQVEMCKEYLYSHIKNIDEKDIVVYEDEGFSAKNLERPMFKKMMSDSKEQKVDYIVCYRLDRISRNVSDFSSLITDLNNRNISFVSIKEQFDTSTPMGRAMMYIASVFAQLERETIAERIRDNMLMLAKTGRWLGGTAPTGYKSEKIQQVLDGKKSKQMFKLKLIPDEVKLIKFIFKKFIETNSLTKVETYLIQNNIKTKNGKTFTRFTIKNILENPVYMVADENAFKFFLNNGVEFSDENDIKSKFDGKYGIMAYNKTLQKDGKAAKTRNIKDWIISVGKHEGLISSSDWITVQEQLAQNSSKSYRKPKSNVALLSGLLFCGNCGDYMRPKLSKRKNASGEYIYSYLCELKEKSRCHNCQMKNPNGNTLDKAVCEEIKKLTMDNSEFLKEINKAKKEISMQSENYEEEISKISKSLSKIENEISSLIKALTNASDTPAQKYITENINNLDTEKNKLLQRKAEIEGLLKSQDLSQIDFDNLKNTALSFSKGFDKMDIEQKREALRTLVDKIVWDGEKVHIYLFGSNGDKSTSSTTDILETKCEDSK
ncbi:MAG: recombinase family protein [Acutalibacteraceae bacterium]